MDASLAFVENKPWWVKQQRELGLERAQQGEGEAAPPGGRVQGRAGPVPRDPGVQVELRLRHPLEAAAGGRGVQHRPPGGGLGDAGEAAQQPQGVRRVHDRDRQHLRADGLHQSLSCTWPGLDLRRADIQGLLQEMGRETDQKKRYALWEQMHQLWYEKVPSVRYGDLHGLRAASKKLQGFNEKTERPRLLQRLARSLRRASGRSTLMTERGGHQTMRHLPGGWPATASRSDGAVRRTHPTIDDPTGRWRMTGRTYRNLAAAVAVIALIIGGAAGVNAQKKGGNHPGRQPGRAADARRSLDDGQHHGDPRRTTSTRAPHAGRREQAHPDARRRPCRRSRRTASPTPSSSGAASSSTTARR